MSLSKPQISSSSTGPRSRWRSLAAPLVLLAACGLLLAATGSTDVPAAAATATDGALRPTTRQRLLAPRIANLLEQAHFSRKRMDDAVSAQVLDHYVESLDSQRSYFTASDVASFRVWRERFDDMIHDGRIDPGFQIFATFQQRNRQRLQYALSLLQAEPDWTRNEEFHFDREQAPWPKDTAELDEIWRLRVKSDALSLVLAGKTWPETVDTLRKRYQRVLTRIDQIKADEVFEALMNAYAAVYDPHSNYFSPVNSEENRIQMSLSYEGIGASLLLTDDYVTISNLLPGGPAAAAGTLQINDRILAVGQGADRGDRLAARRRSAVDPWQAWHAGATADPAGRRRTRHQRAGRGTGAWQGHAREPGGQEAAEDHQA
jgi:carboxyl-terminal processing protease